MMFPCTKCCTSILHGSYRERRERAVDERTFIFFGDRNCTFMQHGRHSKLFCMIDLVEATVAD